MRGVTSFYELNENIENICTKNLQFLYSSATGRVTEINIFFYSHWTLSVLKKRPLYKILSKT